MTADLVSQSHLARLTEAMSPNPGEWRFEGEVEDAGNMTARCACGAHIRYVFWIVRAGDGAKLPIGSVCIEKSVPWLIEQGAGALAEDLRGALVRHREALDEAKRVTRLAEIERDLAGVEEDARALAAWVEATRRNTSWLPATALTLARKVRAAKDIDARTLNTFATLVGEATADLAMHERTRAAFPVPRSEAGADRALTILHDRMNRATDDAARHQSAADEGRSVAWNMERADKAERIVLSASAAVDEITRRAQSMRGRRA